MVTKTLKALIVMMSATLIMIPPAVISATSRTDSHAIEPRHTADAGHPSYGGTLVWGTSNPPTIINPILTSHSVSASLMGLIFDSLVRINGQGRVVPGLAESWKISDDGLEYTFYLKRGVKFHDGKEFSAEDVKFTYEAINDTHNASPWRTNTEMVKVWEITDKYTIKAILNRPSVLFLYKLVREIAPRHLLEGEDLISSSFNSHPIGTGPFRFKNWDRKNNQIELEANSDYFEGRPYLNHLVVKTYPDIARLWSAFMRQEVDLLKYITKEDYYILKDDPSFRTYKIPWDSYYAIAYNFHDPVMADLNIRRAIAYSLNIEEIIKATSGEGVISVGPLHPQSLGFYSQIQAFSYNPEQARSILKKAGWTNANGNGILEKNGKELVITLLVDLRKDMDKTIAMVVRQQLSEVGIKTQLQLYGGESELSSNPFEHFHAQAWLRLFGGSGSAFQSYEAAMNWYSSTSQFGKFGGYKNKKVDELFELAEMTADLEVRARLYSKIHRIVYNDQPACFLFFPMSFHATSKSIKNAEDYFSIYMPVYLLKSAYKKEVRRNGNH